MGDRIIPTLGRGLGGSKVGRPQKYATAEERATKRKRQWSQYHQGKQAQKQVCINVFYSQKYN